MQKSKGCIYYTDNRPNPKFLDIFQKNLRNSFDGEIVCVSLKPTDFGDKRIVMDGLVRSYPTMITQILTALEASTADVVFFTEHDVLYHPSHFEINPTRDDIYYYNINNWRWMYGMPTAITYDELSSLSGMCCNRELAIKHYKYRIKMIEEIGLDKFRSREPRWARRFGYEPGTKPKRRGGITNEGHEKWKSEFPNVDVRHNQTFSKPKVTLKEFKHLPKTWNEIPYTDIPGWNLKEVFKL